MQYGGLHRDPEVDEFGDDKDILHDDAGWSDPDGDGDGDAGQTSPRPPMPTTRRSVCCSRIAPKRSRPQPWTYRRPPLPVRLRV